MGVNWKRHLEVKHNPNAGECSEKGDQCPQAGMVWTVEGEARLADDPTRQWTEYEIDQGKPWSTS
jgi:hypothetical protein